MRMTGLEPARRETLEPKSSASANSATSAQKPYEITKLRTWHPLPRVCLQLTCGQLS